MNNSNFKNGFIYVRFFALVLTGLKYSFYDNIFQFENTNNMKIRNTYYSTICFMLIIGDFLY
jgi:hypothetical protein